MAVPKTCSICGGSGTVGENLCVMCMGSGAAEVAGIPRFLKEHIVDIETKVDALDAKMDTLDAHLAVIETKIDALE